MIFELPQGWNAERSNKIFLRIEDLVENIAHLTFAADKWNRLGVIVTPEFTRDEIIAEIASYCIDEKTYFDVLFEYSEIEDFVIASSINSREAVSISIGGKKRFAASWHSIAISIVHDFTVRSGSAFCIPASLYLLPTSEFYDHLIIYRDVSEEIYPNLKRERVGFFKCLPEDAYPPRSSNTFDLTTLGGVLWNGKEFKGLEPVPWKLLYFCWNSNSRSGKFDGMAEAVWGDREYVFAGEPLKQAVKKINNFFRENQIPLVCNQPRNSQQVVVAPQKHYGVF